MKGYLFTYRTHHYFIRTDSKKKTKVLLQTIIKAMEKIENINLDSLLNNDYFIGEFRKKVTSGEYETLDNHQRITTYGKNGYITAQMNYPLDVDTIVLI